LNSFPKTLRFPELSFQLIIFIEVLDKINDSKNNTEIINTFKIFNGTNKNNPCTVLKLINSILEDDDIAPKSYLEYSIGQFPQYYYIFIYFLF
jgi:hypothetical protein